MKKAMAALMLFMTAVAGSSASAQEVESPWQVRVRAAHLNPADKSTPIGGAGAENRLTIDSKTIPEVDISYFFTPNWAAELILTVPQKQRVALDGSEIGSFKHLPPTLTLQYHFMPQHVFSPYVGGGINYTRISSVDLLGGTTDLENSSVGGALQAGVDIKFDRHWSLNVDIKKLYIRSDVNTATGTISTVKVDPWLIGVGVGYRF